MAITPDPSGGAWVGAKDGLWYTDGERAELVVPARDGRTVCAVVWTGRLWVGDDVGWRVQTGEGFEAVEDRYDACYGFSTAADANAWRAGAGALHRDDDLALPGATRGPVGFLMYPQCETAEGRLDCLDPDNFKYTMSVREVSLA